VRDGLVLATLASMNWREWSEDDWHAFMNEFSARQERYERIQALSAGMLAAANRPSRRTPLARVTETANRAMIVGVVALLGVVAVWWWG
jgi:hypothetical protein